MIKGDVAIKSEEIDLTLHEIRRANPASDFSISQSSLQISKSSKCSQWSADGSSIQFNLLSPNITNSPY